MNGERTSQRISRSGACSGFVAQLMGMEVTTGKRPHRREVVRRLMRAAVDRGHLRHGYLAELMLVGGSPADRFGRKRLRSHRSAIFGTGRIGAAFSGSARTR